MQRRVFNHSLLAGTALAAGGLLSLPAQAQSGFKEGKDYQRLKQPVAVDAAAGTLEEIPTRDKAAGKRCWLCHTTTSHFALRYIDKLIEIKHQETKPRPPLRRQNFVRKLGLTRRRIPLKCTLIDHFHKRTVFHRACIRNKTKGFVERRCHHIGLLQNQWIIHKRQRLERRCCAVTRRHGCRYLRTIKHLKLRQ